MNGYRTYFMFSITNRCNKDCSYCIVKPWLNNPDYPDKIEWCQVRDYFSNALQRGDLVEITGGEPTLVTWLSKFLDLCRDKQAYQILRTNGHRLHNIIPNEYTVICYNPHDENIHSHQTLRKTDWLLHPTIITPKFTGNHDKDNVLIEDGKGIINYPIHPFDNMQFITADGKIRPMTCSEKVLGYIQEGWNPELPFAQCCPSCQFAQCAWNLAARLLYSDKEIRKYRCEGA